MKSIYEYDFEKLKNERFLKMSDIDVMREYTNVLHLLECLKKEPREVFFEYCEQLVDAELYLAGYLARMVCYVNGFDV